MFNLVCAPWRLRGGSELIGIPAIEIGGLMPIATHITGSTLRMRALIVEDDDDVREILEDEFRRHRFEVVVVATADSAATFLDKEKVDVLVTDLDMPGVLSGLDLVHLARVQLPPVPTVLITGRKDLIDMPLSTFECLITKPFALTQVVSVTERLLKSLSV